MAVMIPLLATDFLVCFCHFRSVDRPTYIISVFQSPKVFDGFS
jgi:hypothetical protein